MSHGYKFAQESIKDIFDSLFPLLTEHFAEVSGNLDIPLNPDKDLYIAMEEVGRFVIYVCRSESTSEIVGYAAYFVNFNMHYQQSKQAVQDVVFINKKHRGFGESFINWCDDQLRELGVQVVYHHVKVAHDWSHMLERSGYKFAEKIMSKRLDN